MNSISELLKDFDLYHSAFQIENFIIGIESSDWAQYRQCLREIKTRHDKLIGLRENVALALIPERVGFLKLAKRFLMTRNDIKRASILNQKNTRRYQELIRDVEHTQRELDLFVSIATKLKASIGELNEKKRAMLEADSWMQKARQLAAVEIMAQGRPSKSTIEFILSLPKDSQRSVLLEIKSVKPEKILMIDNHEERT